MAAVRKYILIEGITINDRQLTLTCIVKNCFRKFSKFLAEFANSIIELIFLKQKEQMNLGRLSFSWI